MKFRYVCLFALVTMMAATPAFAGKAVQMWKCGMEDGVTEEAVHDKAAEWLAAAKTVEGGANLEAYVLFPVVVNATGEVDFVYVLVADNFTEWGTFWDHYQDSDAAELEGRDTFCPDSVLWDSEKVE
jgi:hypothetical protein